MKRRDFITFLGGAAVLPSAVWGQTNRRPVRIGYLSAAGYMTPLTGPDFNLNALRDGFRALGRQEGSDYIIISRYSGENYDLFPSLVEELLKERVDVLVTGGPASRVARIAGLPVPVVFAFSGDPVDAGLVSSFARPSGNATGVSLLALEIAAKRVEMLKEVAPSAKQLAVIANPKHPGYLSELRVTRDAAQASKLAVQLYEVQSVTDFEPTFATLERDGCDCIIAFPEVLTLYNRQLVNDLAIRRKLPSMFGWKLYVQSGGLISYGPNLHDAYAHLAVFVDKLLNGKRPADIPIEQPTHLELIINLKTAKILGLTVPPSLLARADELIE